MTRPGGKITDPRYGTYRWKKLRASILERDGHTCGYCRGEATSVDHRVPITRGGDFWDPANLVAACVPCNSGKKDRPRRAPGARWSTASPVYGPCKFHGADCGAFHSRDW